MPIGIAALHHARFAQADELGVLAHGLQSVGQRLQVGMVRTAIFSHRVEHLLGVGEYFHHGGHGAMSWIGGKEWVWFSY